MRFALHPEAALEHEEQAAYYESKSPGLGRRYHAAFRAALERVCEAPHRYKLTVPPNIRRFALRSFPFYILYRESNAWCRFLPLPMIVGVRVIGLGVSNYALEFAHCVRCDAATRRASALRWIARG